jgi:hypothetical protein
LNGSLKGERKLVTVYASGKKYLLADLNFWRKIANPIPTLGWTPAIRVKSHLSLFKKMKAGNALYTLGLG